MKWLMSRMSVPAFFILPSPRLFIYRLELRFCVFEIAFSHV